MHRVELKAQQGKTTGERPRNGGKGKKQASEGEGKVYVFEGLGGDGRIYKRGVAFLRKRMEVESAKNQKKIFTGSWERWERSRNVRGQERR